MYVLSETQSIKTNVYRILVGVTERTHLEELSTDGTKNIRMDFKETGRNSVDWINIPQDGDSGRLCEHNDKYLGYTKCRELLD